MSLDSNPCLSLVSPCFNESKALVEFMQVAHPVLEKTACSYEVIFVNDGSTDNTLKVLLKLKDNYPNIHIINLSRNFGKESALTAGIDESKGNVVIPIDADLQHPPELILTFIKQWKEGYDVVLAKRTNRAHESASKRLGANIFYKLLQGMSSIIIPKDVGDFRLMSRKVVDALKQLPENQRFMKGIFAWVGFKTTNVEYEVAQRHADKSRFNIWKLWNLALEGVTSFSSLPLRVWLYIGLLISTFSFIYGSVIIIRTLAFGVDAPGYASLMTSILFLGGIQLIGIGILGEYIGRIYIESKRRPIYIIENRF